MKPLCCTMLWLFVLVTNGYAGDEPRLTILLYHGLSEHCAVDIYEKRKESFYADMEYIRNHFDVLSLADVKDVMNKKKTLLRNSVAIAFDDGLISNYTTAVPILEEFGFPATFFIITDRCGEDGFMTWEQVVDLSQKKDKNGNLLFSIGSHSCSHQFPGLQGLSYDQLKHELEDSKKILEEHTGLPCVDFALPYGRRHGDQLVINLAREAGYEMIRTSIRNSVSIENDDLFNLPCLPIYDFTPSGYIGEFINDPSLDLPFFDPVQDIHSGYNPVNKSYTFDVDITGIYSYTISENEYVSVEMVSEDNDAIEDVHVDYTAPGTTATVRITTKPGCYDHVKMDIRVKEPASHDSYGYFYIYFAMPPITPPVMDPIGDVSAIEENIEVTISGISSTLYDSNDHIKLEVDTDHPEFFKEIKLDYQPSGSQAKLLLALKDRSGTANITLKVHENLGVYNLFTFKVNTVISGLEDSGLGEVFLFPNPVADRMEIKNADNNVTYRIYNASGQLQHTGRGNLVNVASLPQGMYIMCIYKGKDTIRQKFSVIRR